MLEHPAASAIFVVTAAISLLGLYRMPALIERSLFRPYYFIRARQFETIFTSGFVHADLGHLLFNMVTFYFFAFPLEERIGSWRFTLLYAVGLVLSHSCSYFKHHNNRQYASLGASGAVAAVLFAYIVYFPRSTLLIFPIPVPIPAVLFALGYVGYSWWAAQQQRGRINHDAHFCGALSGFAFVAGTDPQAWSTTISSFF